CEAGVSPHLDTLDPIHVRPEISISMTYVIERLGVRALHHRVVVWFNNAGLRLLRIKLAQTRVCG
ncbi:MAG: hypothetical protein PHT38_05210, partial [Halothiobacillus sp.]|nr:hypothetical protein [Halothiobacillus sp.]